VLTIATHKRKTKLDYGVLRFSDDVSCAIQLRSFHEKPELTMTVSMGIYLIEPEVLDYIPRGEPFDIPDLVQKLLRNGQPVGGYQFDGFWLDIGRPDDYEEANRVWDALEPLLLK
jgi:NDP-sugar pyrophosphorylase family protein